MAVTNFTSLLGLALPTTGDLSGTWGVTVNDSITTLLDSAVAGTTTLTTDGDVTLSTTNGASNQARQAIILLTGARSGAHNVTAPAQSKAYIVNNATTGGYAITFRGAGPTAGVSIGNGERCLVAWNGSDFVKIASTAISNLTGVLGVANGGTGVATVTGVLRGNGTSAFSAATAGTDYLAPPSGTAIMKANSGGALANAVAGTDYLAPPSGTAIMKANSGGALANATAGTDYVAPGTATTFTATQTFNGSSSVLATALANAAETTTVSATAATGTINYDTTTQSVLYYTSNAAANWTVNFRGSSGTSLDSLMSTGQAITVVFLVTNGATAYYNSAVTIDGNAVVPKYQSATAWTFGNVNSIDAYTYTIIKTGAATFTVFASQTRFG